MRNKPSSTNSPRNSAGFYDELRADLIWVGITAAAFLPLVLFAATTLFVTIFVMAYALMWYLIWIIKTDAENRTHVRSPSGDKRTTKNKGREI